MKTGHFERTLHWLTEPMGNIRVGSQGQMQLRTVTPKVPIILLPETVIFLCSWEPPASPGHKGTYSTNLLLPWALGESLASSCSVPGPEPLGEDSNQMSIIQFLPQNQPAGTKRQDHVVHTGGTRGFLIQDVGLCLREWVLSSPFAVWSNPCQHDNGTPAHPCLLQESSRRLRGKTSGGVLGGWVHKKR